MDLCREMIEIASRIASTEEIPFRTSNLHLILYLTGRELAISCSSNTVSIFIMSNFSISPHPMPGGLGFIVIIATMLIYLMLSRESRL